MMAGIYIKNNVTEETKRIVKGYAGKNGIPMGQALNELVKTGEQTASAKRSVGAKR